MSFAKKPLVPKGSKKPEKSLLEQIQTILGTEYSVEQIQNALKNTNDVQMAIKILKSERDALLNNSRQLKIQQLNKTIKVEKKVSKYISQWKCLKDNELIYNNELLEKIHNQMTKININDVLLTQIVSNFNKLSHIQ